MATKPTSLPVWATSTGSTIISGLTATGATFISTVTRGAVYGRIRYTFSGSPSFASVLVGYKLTITGMTDALNNITNAEIYSVDDSADTIDILITSRLDATADETGASGTGTVTDAGALIQVPSSARQSLGHLAPQLPGDGYENWYKNLVYQWCNYLNDFVAGAIDVTQASHGFAAGDAVYESSGTWAKAQGNARATADNVYLVTSVTDTNNFTVARDGRRNITKTSHGYSVNDMLYLDPDTPAGLVNTKPIGNTSRSLGYYVPIGKVSAVADVNNFTINLAIPVEPVFNQIYARYKPTSPSSAVVSFNIDIDNVGSHIDIRGSVTGDGAGHTNVYLTYNSVYNYDTFLGYVSTVGSSSSASWTTNTSGSASEIIIADERNSDNRDLTFSGSFTKGGNFCMYNGMSMTSYPDAFLFCGQGVAENVTTLKIGLNNTIFNGANDYIDLIIHQMPVS